MMKLNCQLTLCSEKIIFTTDIQYDTKKASLYRLTASHCSTSHQIHSMNSGTVWISVCVMFFNHLHSAMAAVWPHKIKKLINIILLSNLTCITMITKQTNISYTITLSPKVDDNGVGPWSYDITVLYKSAYKYCYFTFSSKRSWGMTKITSITKCYKITIVIVIIN